MIKEIIHDPIFLAGKSEAATAEDLQVAEDLLDTLTANIAMIDVDSEKAKDSVVSFSDYLRVNLDALKDAKLVPFEKELEHCKTYLGF